MKWTTLILIGLTSAATLVACDKRPSDAAPASGNSCIQNCDPNGAIQSDDPDSPPIGIFVSSGPVVEWNYAAVTEYMSNSSLWKTYPAGINFYCSQNPENIKHMIETGYQSMKHKIEKYPYSVSFEVTNKALIAKGLDNEQSFKRAQRVNYSKDQSRSETRYTGALQHLSVNETSFVKENQYSWNGVCTDCFEADKSWPYKEFLIDREPYVGQNSKGTRTYSMTEGTLEDYEDSVDQYLATYDDLLWSGRPCFREDKELENGDLVPDYTITFQEGTYEGLPAIQMVLTNPLDLNCFSENLVQKRTIPVDQIVKYVFLKDDYRDLRLGQYNRFNRWPELPNRDRIYRPCGIGDEKTNIMMSEQLIDSIGKVWQEEIDILQNIQLNMDTSASQ